MILLLATSSGMTPIRDSRISRMMGSSTVEMCSIGQSYPPCEAPPNELAAFVYPKEKANPND